LWLVAYLSAFGVTFGMASLALSVLRALAVASVVLALLLSYVCFAPHSRMAFTTGPRLCAEL